MPRAPDAALAAQIRARAHAVHRPGCWVGLFDWCVFAAFAQLRLHVLIGANAVDLLAVFAPALGRSLPAGSRSVYVVAAVLEDGLSLIPGGDLPRVNHWLPAAVLGDTTHVAPATSLAFSARQRLGSPADVILLQEFYRPLGFVVHSSVCQGDCGPDAALCLTGGPRNLVAWSSWRADLATYMLARADDTLWQASRAGARRVPRGSQPWAPRPAPAQHARTPRVTGPPVSGKGGPGGAGDQGGGQGVRTGRLVAPGGTDVAGGLPGQGWATPGPGHPPFRKAGPHPAEPPIFPCSADVWRGCRGCPGRRQACFVACQENDVAPAAGVGVLPEGGENGEDIVAEAGSGDLGGPGVRHHPHFGRPAGKGRGGGAFGMGRPPARRRGGARLALGPGGR